jgi:hypothetical protein
MRSFGRIGASVSLADTTGHGTPASIVTVSGLATALVRIAKLLVTAPGANRMLAGTTARGLSLWRVTRSPPSGAGAVSVILPRVPRQPDRTVLESAREAGRT